MPKKILLVGGGTGWHVFPLLNLVTYLKKSSTSEQIQFHWVGEADSIESRISQENKIPFSPIVCGKLRRYFSLRTLLVPFQMFIGIVQSIVILFHEKPTAIFSKGGYVSLPVAIAGWAMRIPIYFHESDSVPGLANKIVGKFATGIFTAFPEADTFFENKKILGHGPMLSSEIQAMVSQKNEINEWRTQMLISCGSQGSSTIFDAVLSILSFIPEIDVHVVLGVKNPAYREKFQAHTNVAIYDFFYNQTEYLKVVQKCDLVIARSGSSIFEFEALWLQMILIPHPQTGNNHQYWNAKAFEKKGHELILQENLAQKLPMIMEKYKHFKKTPTKWVVDMTIFDTIAQITSR